MPNRTSIYNGIDLGKSDIANGGFEVVSSLPTTNLFVGRKVCYGGKDYMYNGTAWTNDATTLGGILVDYFKKGVGKGSYYKDVVNISLHGTATEILIKTKIPFISSSQMPLIHLEGYAYGAASPIELRIAFYIYSSSFVSLGCTSTCPWNPDIKLFTYVDNSTTYVGIALIKDIYYPQCTINYIDVWGGGSGVQGRNYSENWTIEYNTVTTPSIVPTDNLTSIPYRPIANSITGNAATATDSDKLDGKHATSFSNASDSMDFTISAEPTSTGTSTQTHLYGIQYLLKGLQWLYTNWKSLFSETSGSRIQLSKMQHQQPYINGSSVIGVNTDTVIDWRAGANITITPEAEINGLRPVTIAATGGGNIDLSQLSNSYIPHWNTNTQKFENSRILDNGTQIGVGTTSPEADFHVVRDDGGNTQTFYVENKASVGRVLFQVKASGQGGPYLDFRSYSPGYHENLAGFDLAGATIFNLVPKAIGHVFNVMTAFPMIFCTNNTEKMRIASNGNVGINNNNPVEKLDVGGNIKLTGKLIEAVYGNITTLVACNSIITLMNSNVANAYYFKTAITANDTINLSSLTNLISNYEYSIILRATVSNGFRLTISDGVTSRSFETGGNTTIISIKFRKIGNEVILTYITAM